MVSSSAVVTPTRVGLLPASYQLVQLLGHWGVSPWEETPIFNAQQPSVGFSLPAPSHCLAQHREVVEALLQSPRSDKSSCGLCEFFEFDFCSIHLQRAFETNAGRKDCHSDLQNQHHQPTTTATTAPAAPAPPPTTTNHHHPPNLQRSANVSCLSALAVGEVQPQARPATKRVDGSWDSTNDGPYMAC